MKYGIIKLFGYVGKEIKEALNIGDDFFGFDLIDVIAQVKQVGAVDAYVFVINSAGGFVNIGKDVYNYMVELSTPFYTIDLLECSSIATKPFLAAPLENRIILATAKMMIHNPWDSVQGDAAHLIAAGNSVKEAEDELIEFYSEVTGTPESAMQSFMAAETYLTPQECVTLGFAGKIMTLEQATAMFGDISSPLATQPQPAAKTTFKALAVFNPKINNMSKPTKSQAWEKIKKFAKALNMSDEEIKKLAADPAAPAAGLTLTTDDGKTITIATPADPSTPSVNDVIALDGKPAPSATLTTTDGTVITTDANSAILTIQAASQSEGDMEARAVKAEQELVAVNAKLKAAEDKVKALEATHETEISAINETLDTLMAVAEATKSGGKGGEEATRLAAERKAAADKAAGEKSDGVKAASDFRAASKQRRINIAKGIAGKK